ncbi:MAG: NAD/NADP octopine/nopaline dehydrogenase family protein [Methylobacteriaceae bacterium]|nr:NAD/NADP octopine/nopaline dehydrogenase family protein [Methylobacteriaceae bacterium]
MRVGVVGTGPVGLGCAALLASRGHEPVLWSPRAAPRGASRRIEAVGLFAWRGDVRVAREAPELTGCEAIVICVLGAGHRATFEALAPIVRDGQSVIISSHASLGALYLSRLVAARGVAAPVIAWSTTLTGGPIIEGRVHVRLLRGEIDLAAVPASGLDAATMLCRALFDARFTPRANLLAIALGNLNPPIHLAQALLNFTRIEQGEVWDNFGCVTAGVGRLIEALDAERLAVARAFGVEVRTAREHYLKSFPDLVAGSVAEMAAQVAAQRKGSSPGPARVDTRYVTEDIPFGIHPVIALAKIAGVPTPLHAAGLAVMSAVYGRDLAADNDLLPRIGLEGVSRDGLLALATRGWGAA